MARDIKHKAQSLKTGEWIIGYYVYLKDMPVGVRAKL